MVRSSVAEVDASFFLRFQHRTIDCRDGAETVEFSQGDSGFRLTYRGELIREVPTIAGMLAAVPQFLLRLEHPDRSLLAYAHAAAVCRGGHSILMPGPGGAGKSTLTAFLVARGFDYLGDDIIALAEDDGALLPLPTSLSIKSGSWDLVGQFFATLANRPSLFRYGRTMRYLEPEGNYQALTSAPSPSAIVFPAYKAGAPTRLSPLPPLQTMLRLVGAQAALLPPATEGRLAKLVEFVEQTPAYELTYSELPGALQAIEDLLASQN